MSECCRSETVAGRSLRCGEKAEEYCGKRVDELVNDRCRSCSFKFSVVLESRCARERVFARSQVGKCGSDLWSWVERVPGW